MTALTRAVAALAAEARVASFGDSSIPPNSSVLGNTGAGTFVTEQGALAISTVLNCVKVLSDDVSVLPFVDYTGPRRGLHKEVPNPPPVVVEPFGPDMSPAQGFGQIVVSLALRGNAYVQIVSKDRDGFPTLLSVLHPDRVQVSRDSNGVKQFAVNGQLVKDPTSIKHMTGTMLPGSLVGIDPVSYQRVTLGLAGDVNQYGANFFRNGGFPNIVLMVKGAASRARAREVRDIYEASHSGVANAHRPAVIFGDTTLNPIIGVPPENAQFLQTRQFMREEICGWFGVPLSRIHAGGQAEEKAPPKGAGGTGKEQYAIETLMPITATIEDCWQTMLPPGQWGQFDFDELLRVSAVDRATIAQIHRVTAVRTPDEIRADEGWDPLPDGMGADPRAPLNSNTSPAGGASNAPAPGGQDNPGAVPGATGGDNQ